MSTAATVAFGAGEPAHGAHDAAALQGRRSTFAERLRVATPALVVRQRKLRLYGLAKQCGLALHHRHVMLAELVNADARGGDSEAECRLKKS